MSALTLKHPISYKSVISKLEGKERAQWTRVFVMPRSVTAAQTDRDKTQN